MIFSTPSPGVVRSGPTVEKNVSLKPDEIASNKLLLQRDAPTDNATEDNWVVSASGVGKRFDIYKNDRGRMFEFFGQRSHHQEHWALRDVNFKVERGRSFGIIGPNGAGKSTLLKLMGGITRPTEGEIRVRAQLSTLLDLGLGFHQNFSGRENTRLNCTLLGMTAREIDERLPDIINFAELGEFIDYPVRTYSAGMNLRLGFSIAAHTDADVFLIDEVLAVGDQYFQRRCIDKIEEFLANGKTIILVSHDLHSVRSLCDEVLWIENGQVRALGSAKDVVERYVDIERERSVGAEARKVRPFLAPIKSLPTPTYDATVDDPKLKKAIMEAVKIHDLPQLAAEHVDAVAYDVVEGDTPVVQGTGEVRVLDVRILDGEGRDRERFQNGEDLIVTVTFRTTCPIENPIFGAAVYRSDGVYVHGPNSKWDNVLEGSYHGIYTFFLQWKGLPLLAGRYRLSIAVFDQGHLKPFVWHNQLHDFEVVTEVEDHGMVMMEHAWGLITHLEK
jgi:ABC-type polysaccharide/polyol phosphate transport system ATPase subunit